METSMLLYTLVAAVGLVLAHLFGAGLKFLELPFWPGASF
jgi:hypothetical protein